MGNEIPDVEHTRPNGVSDATVAALGKLSEALEVVEHARGHLYGFHRLCGTADLTLGEAVDAFREAGHDALADRRLDLLVAGGHPSSPSSSSVPPVPADSSRRRTGRAFEPSNAPM